MMKNSYSQYIRKNEHDIEFIDIANKFARATICLQGAQVCQYTPAQGNNLLWMSDKAVFEPNTAIRGGIPICWPWFGPHTNASYPAHGLVRQTNWHLDSITEHEFGTDIILSITHNDVDNSMFPYQFELTLTVQVGTSLTLSLTTKNKGNSPFNISEAFHTYFAVSDINKVSISGLQGEQRINNLTSPPTLEIQESENIKVDCETEYVYINSLGDIALSCPLQKISLTRQGAKSLVVWNPWIDKAKTLSHFNDNDYQQMMCLESANALDNGYQLDAGESHTMTTSISN